MIDHQYWLKKEAWTTSQSSFLLCGLNPHTGYMGNNPSPKLDRIRVPYSPEQILAIKYKKSIIYQAIDEGELKIDTTKESHDFYTKQPYEEDLFYPENMIGWAINKGLNIPIAFVEWYEKQQTSLTTMPENPQQPSNQNKGLSDDVMDSLLKLVLGMAINAYRYDPNAKKNTATGENKGSIHYALKSIGLDLDADTIRKYIKLAEARFKDDLSKP